MARWQRHWLVDWLYLSLMVAQHLSEGNVGFIEPERALWPK